MPQGNIPSKTLELDFIPNKEGQWGSYGPDMLERTRVGLDNLLYLQAANRGQRVSITGWHYLNSREAAVEHIKTIEALAGNEVTLKSTLDGWSTMAFLFRIAGSVRRIGDASVKIGSITKSVSYRALYQIEMQRTF
jgi:hypothetical protein